MKKSPAPASQSEFFTEEEVMDLEQKIIDVYLKNDKKPTRLLFKLYAKYWKEFLVSMFFYLINHSPVIIMPIIVANITNAVEHYITKGTPWQQPVFINLAIIMVLIVLNVPTHMLYTRFYSIMVRRVEAGLRGAMVRKLNQLSITFHKEMQSGRIQSKLINDVEAVYNLSTQILVTMPAIIINIVTAIAIVVSKSIIVFVFFVCCIPANVILLRFFSEKMYKSNRNFRKNMESTSASLMDMEEMTQITRAHALENQEIRKMTSLLKNVANSGYKLDMIQSLFGALLWVVIQVFQLSCLIFSAWQYTRGDIQEIGDIALFQGYFSSLIGQVSTVVGLLPLITKGMESLSSIGEILGATDIEESSGKEEVYSIEGNYEFKNVSFSYDSDQHLLNNLNFSVKAGETVAIVGESGSGKSTMLNLAIGFIHPQGGKVLIDGKDLEKINLQSYRKHIAIVPQNSVMFTGTIRENITYGLENVTDEQLKTALDAAKMYDFVKSLPNGVDTKLDEHGANLSGGQRQRLSIARAIIRDPSVIILDEATSALDNVSEREIQAAINRLTTGKTTFIVAHRLSTIRNADKIAVLKQGQCVELGTYDELLALKGEFYKMHHASEAKISEFETFAP